jgi:hypothetical protein
MAVELVKEPLKTLNKNISAQKQKNIELKHKNKNFKYA